MMRLPTHCGHQVPWDADCPDCDGISHRVELEARAEREWRKGFPPRGGSYLVLMADGEQCVTRWNDGGERHQGERVKPGWPCLNVQVEAWAYLLPAPSWARATRFRW